jgi:hypothetical protein
LDNIVFPEDDLHVFDEGLIQETIGEMVPNQFGYILQVSEDGGQTWYTAYDTSSQPIDNHADYAKKLQVSTYVMAFAYPDTINKMNETPYNYNTCGFAAGWEEGDSTGTDGSTWHDWGVITCGELWDIYAGDGGVVSSSTVIGNTPPENLLGGELVPAIDVKLVKFTIFI